MRKRKREKERGERKGMPKKVREEGEAERVREGKLREKEKVGKKGERKGKERGKEGKGKGKRKNGKWERKGRVRETGKERNLGLGEELAQLKGTRVIKLIIAQIKFREASS